MFIKSIFSCILFFVVHGALNSALAQQGDPTRPPSVIAQQLAPLQANTGFELSAIFTRNNQRYAVLNGAVLKQGDEYMGMKVTGISAFEVTLQNLRENNKDLILQVQNNAGMSKQVVK